MRKTFSDRNTIANSLAFYPRGTKAWRGSGEEKKVEIAERLVNIYHFFVVFALCDEEHTMLSMSTMQIRSKPRSCQFSIEKSCLETPEREEERLCLANVLFIACFPLYVLTSSLHRQVYRDTYSYLEFSAMTRSLFDVSANI